ncbi:MAG: acetyl-CoA carboxylase biotin carboxyl carrier protein [Candidatus Omnitrophica bacterium]|nr:acetyl-CoA carboxylase biotin carboxyl carrier protein [Candidatus Omnitrophota bacterium]MCM8768956.1 acetyl-CoA carboxylase biotin carboxyl carrier protein [Candidatus Omnitrophota bacterium]
MAQYGLDYLEVRKGDFKLILGKKTALSEEPLEEIPVVSTTPEEILKKSAEETQELGHLIYVKSPLVGTFYRAPSPESPPFVEVGSKVKPGDTLCIVEAMKVMNEIKSEHQAVVKEILVENAKPVEYGQVIFVLDTSG